MTTPPAPDATLQRLVDHDQLQRLIHQVGRCLDDGDFDGLRDIYTDDAVAHTPGGRVVGIDALIDQARRVHTRTPAVQHQITDILIDIDANQAEARANLLVTFTDDHVPPRPGSQQGEIYRFTARRYNAGWKLAGVRSTPVWAAGERP